MNPYSKAFRLDSAVSWQPSPDPELITAADSPARRTQGVIALADLLIDAGLEVRVTPLFLPAVFWIFADAEGPTSGLWELPLRRSQRGENLYIDLDAGSEGLGVYAAFFDTLWDTSRPWGEARQGDGRSPSGALPD
jgi:hypothetical protein